MRTKKHKNQISESGYRLKLLFFILFSFCLSMPVNAQCAMCRAALESEGNGVKAEAVNDGIIYLMAFPYILIALIGYFIYKTGKKIKSKQ